ncbi:MAG: flippase [Deltaproteobacteria bacterium]|nr:flippase [Deltaproteobacteria bacterium]
MTGARRIAKNAVFVLAARVIEAALNLAVFALVARYLGIEGFGVYSFIIAAIWVLSPLVFLGLNQILARDVALDKDNAASAIGGGIILNILMTIPLVIASLFIILIFSLDRTGIIALFLTIAAFIPRAFIRNFFGVIIAYEDMRHLTFVTVVTRVAEVALIYAVVAFDLGFTAIFTASFLAEAFGFIVCLVLFRKIFAVLRIRVDWRQIKHLFMECLPVTISLLLVEAFLYVDVFVLKFMASNADIGLFQGPHKILTRLQMIPMAFFIVFLPVYSRLVGSEETMESFNQLVSKTFKLILIFALPISIFGVAYSDRIIRLLFGEAFIKAADSLQILLWAFPFLCLTTLYRYLFIALKKQRLIVVSDTICVLCNLILDIILVPSYGFVGASYGTLGAIIVQFAVNYVLLFRQFRKTSWQKAFLAPACSAAALGLFTFGFGRADSVTSLAVGLVVYFVALFFLKTFSAEDLLFFKNSIRSS